MSGSNLSPDRSWDAGASLWQQLFGEPPPVRCDARTLFEVLVANLAHAGPYHLEPEPRRRSPVDPPFQSAECPMPHQNTDSSKATAQNSVTPSAPNDQAREQNRAVHAEPRSYVAADVADATLAPPAAGEVADYMDEGEALDMEGSQQGSNHSNRPRVTEAKRGQGKITRAANREIARSGRAG